MDKKSGKIILKAEELEGFLNEEDKRNLDQVEELYRKTMKGFENLDDTQYIIDSFEMMGDLMQKITGPEESIKVYPFETHRVQHGEVSRLISKLRDTRTGNSEFVYYIQRSYELLFNLMYGLNGSTNRNYIITKTPVTEPVQNYAVHKIPDVDKAISNTVMCVMLRGALLPSMILSKEIQEYSSNGYTTPFALFKIKRDDSKKKSNMEYILDLDRSFFNLEELDGKDLVFADPMNATGGSLVTIIKYLLEQGVKPASIKLVNVIASLQGLLQITRSVQDITCYTLWLDPYLNESAYILPGLGDAGDRINGVDSDDNPRNMLQLLGDYGQNLISLYRSQVREIEERILEK